MLLLDTLPVRFVYLELWKEVKKAAIDEGVTATEFLQEALKDRLAKFKLHKEQFKPT